MAGTATAVSPASAPARGLRVEACCGIFTRIPMVFLTPHTICRLAATEVALITIKASQGARQRKQMTYGAPPADKIGLNCSSLPYAQIERLHVIEVFVR